MCEKHWIQLICIKAKFLDMRLNIENLFLIQMC